MRRGCGTRAPLRPGATRGLNTPGRPAIRITADQQYVLVRKARQQQAEEAQTLGTRQGTLRGLGVTGGVITAAGVVMAGTFAALTQLPSVPVAQVGIAVAVGVLLDTLLVRTVLVPAALLTLGERAWWPSRPAEAGRECARWPGRSRCPGSTKRGAGQAATGAAACPVRRVQPRRTQASTAARLRSMSASVVFQELTLSRMAGGPARRSARTSRCRRAAPRR